MKNILTLLILIFVLLCQTAILAQDSCGPVQSVFGFVTVSDQPVEATVALLDSNGVEIKSTQTDKSGLYKFSGLSSCAATYSLLASDKQEDFFPLLSFQTNEIGIPVRVDLFGTSLK